MCSVYFVPEQVSKIYVFCSNDVFHACELTFLLQPLYTKNYTFNSAKVGIKIITGCGYAYKA